MTFRITGDDKNIFVTKKELLLEQIDFSLRQDSGIDFRLITEVAQHKYQHSSTSYSASK